MGSIIWKKGVKKSSLKDSYLIVGLPGIGLIGRIAVRYMVDKLKAKKIADIYSEYFPAQALMSKSGNLRLLKQSLYFFKGKNQSGKVVKIVFLTGDVQPLLPEGQFLLSKKVVDLFHSLKVKEIITIGGYSTGVFKEKKRIFGAANNKEYIKTLKKFGVIFGEAKGSIVGMAGVIPAYAKTKRIKSVCLMGETHGAFVDATSSKKVVQLLSKYFGLKINLKELGEVAKAGEAMVKKIEKELETATKGEKHLSYIR